MAYDERGLTKFDRLDALAIHDKVVGGAEEPEQHFKTVCLIELHLLAFGLGRDGSAYQPAATRGSR